MPRPPIAYNATLTAREDLSDGLALFRVVPDEWTYETFVPGQYAVLGLNHQEKGPVQRQYSIASAPQTIPNYLEFYVRYVYQPASDNPLTHLLFDLKVGDRLFMGPKIRGKFTVEHELGSADDRRVRVCVAAGTGLAPFTSMVFDHLARGGSPDQYVILHGASYSNQLGYRAELEAAMNDGRPHPTYFPTISRPKNDPNWPADAWTGRVECLLEPDNLARLESAMGKSAGWFNPQNVVVFICGLQGTIANTVLSLLERGFVPGETKLRAAFGIPKETAGSVFFEQYDSEPILDLKNAELVADCRAKLEAAGVVLEPAAG